MYLNQDSPKNISCEVIIKCKFYAEILKTDFFLFLEKLYGRLKKISMWKQNNMKSTKQKKIP